MTKSKSSKKNKMAPRPDFVNPNSKWLVICECIYHVIEVSIPGDGFFIPGQEPCWSFDHVQEWIREIIVDEKSDVTITKLRRALRSLCQSAANVTAARCHEFRLQYIKALDQAVEEADKVFNATGKK